MTEDLQISGTVIDHFLVIGAGALLGARIDLAGPLIPPVGAKLSRYLMDWLAANDFNHLDSAQRTRANNRCDSAQVGRCKITSDGAVRQRLHDLLFHSEQEASSDEHVGFEIAVKRLWSQRQKACANYELPIHLNRLIGLSFCCGSGCAFVDQIDRYDDLARKFCALKTAIISLNYDVLFEEAWQRINGTDSLHYPGLRFLVSKRPVGIPVYKLHGSINWFEQSGVGRSKNLNVAQKNVVSLKWDKEANVRDTQREYAVVGPRAKLVCEMKRHPDTYRPVMALYVPGKHLTANPEPVRCARRSCMEVIHQNKHAAVSVVGVHVPTCTDDGVLLDCLTALGKLEGQRVFVNPSKDECEAAAAIGFSTRQETFAEYLAQS